MNLSDKLGILHQLYFATSIAILPTCRAVLRSPSLLLRPHALSRVFMVHVWSQFGPGIDENTQGIKEALITPNAHGVVLDVGAGYGHTAKYLQAERVTKYVPLEPNVLMHDEIRKHAAEHGFTEANGKLLILSYGAQDTNLINSALGGENAVDSIVAVLTLCSIPSPKEVCESLFERVLKPGGTFVYYEHVQSPREDVAWWQWFWTPLWKKFFDGCCIDRPTHLWIDAMPFWAEKESKRQEDEPEGHLFHHRIGKYVKKA
ncbi:hypothetical protein QCA50_015073 [Cerrena zonata]|uniref:S-adenosyl-L-methionine-dependent methyltransferase n=1 Tax=Cerrena zonata TaxID=2478898 RepID=A0AAW0FM38_9APHY